MAPRGMQSACPGPTSICLPSIVQVQDPLDAIDRLFVMVVAMRRCRQALRAGDSELKGRDAAIRFFSGDQEAYRERPETDGFLRRIDVQVDGLLCHLCLLLVNGVHHACTSNSVVAA